MKRTATLLGLAALTLSGPAAGQDSFSEAMALGSLLGAEEFCGLSYDQAAVSAWIDTNVDPADMQFASRLRAMTRGGASDLDEMTESQKTAHCRAVLQSPRAAGFIE